MNDWEFFGLVKGHFYSAHSKINERKDISVSRLHKTEAEGSEAVSD